MQFALFLTLLFVAATSAQGGLRSTQIAVVSRRRSQLFGAVVAFAMSGWCLFLAFWFWPA